MSDATTGDTARKKSHHDTPITWIYPGLSDFYPKQLMDAFYTFSSNYQCWTNERKKNHNVMDWLFNPIGIPLTPATQNVVESNGTMLPMQYVHHCRRLLLDHESAWIDYQQRVMRDHWMIRRPVTHRQPTDPWKNGSKYDCAKNTCSGIVCGTHHRDIRNVNVARCTFLEMNIWTHLVPTTENGPQLTYDQCKRLGYLDRRSTNNSSSQ